MTSKLWKEYTNKKIILLIEDTPYPRKREGILIDYDETHVWLQTDVRKEPIPFLRSSIKRIDLNKEQKEDDGKR